MKTFVDTNVWVYSFDLGDDGRRTRARAAVEAIGRRDVVVSTQVLLELFDVLTRSRRDSSATPVDEAASLVSALGRLTVVGTDTALVSAAIDTHRATGLRIWDAMILEAAVRGGCGRLLTEDLSHGQVVRGVEIVDPFVGV